MRVHLSIRIDSDLDCPIWCPRGMDVVHFDSASPVVPTNRGAPGLSIASAGEIAVMDWIWLVLSDDPELVK